MIDIAKANQQLAAATPQEIIEWTLTNVDKPLVSTHFGPHEAVILHMVTQIKTGVPVIWVDSGYATRDTYLVAKRLMESLDLNLTVYTPTMTSMRWDCAYGGIPDVDDERHERFTELFKLEPFSRAMKEQAPEAWLTAVRKDQTEFRQGIEVFSHGPNGVVKVAPLLNWNEQDMDAYLQQYELPNVKNYFDPTKGLNNRECGLHTQL